MARNYDAARREPTLQKTKLGETTTPPIPKTKVGDLPSAPSIVPEKGNQSQFDADGKPLPTLDAGYHPEAHVPTQKTARRHDWLSGTTKVALDANTTAHQAKSVLDNVVLDYHREVTGGTMRALNKDELLGLANKLSGEYSGYLDVLVSTFDDKSIFPGRPSVMIGGLDPDGPTVWFNGWRKGEQTAIHSHNETQGSVSVHRGKVREKVWDTDSGQLQHNREFKTGQGAAIPTPYIHQVVNEREELATTVHAYHPPLYMQELYQLVDGKAVMTGRWEDDERVEWEARMKERGGKL